MCVPKRSFLGCDLKRGQGRSEFHIVVGDVTPSLAAGVRQKALVSGRTPSVSEGVAIT